MVGRIGSVPANIRAAYNRRVRCKCKNKIDTIKPLLVSLVQITTPGTNVTPSFDFSSNEVGTITSNYVFTSTTNAVVGSNTITFYNLASGTYSDVFVQVTDLVGNMSKKLILESFVINDAVPPVISAVTQIATPANDSTPSFVFNSNEAGTITSSHAFTSTTSAISGDNTITFSQLVDGTYSGLWVKVTDATLNVSNQLTLVDFVIETAPPVLSALTQIATPGNDSTPSFDFSSNEVGTITSNYVFTSTTNAVVDSNTITFDTLLDGTYSGLWVKVTDSLGNISNQLTLADFVIDTVSPTIGPVTPIATPTTDNTPSFVFNSNEAGTITSSHAFTSTTSSISGNNTITFSPLADGTYNTVWVKVTDAAGNVSNQLPLDPFTIDTNTECLTLNTSVNVVLSGGNKYVFNGGTTYDSSKKYGLNNATYTFKDIPIGHPLAILNNGNADITYAAVANTSSPIRIKVSGGNTSVNSGDYYDFKDENDNTINIGNGTFRFMRGKTYKFEATGIMASHPFKIYMSSAFVNDNNSSNSGISGSSGSITITIPTNHSTSAGDLYYQCSNHSGMKKNLSLFYTSVSGTTNDESYDFFYDDVAVTVSGDFGDVSVYCYHHGYMGGESLLKYKSTCSP